MSESPPRCDRCGVPIADGPAEFHWKRIARGWERLVTWSLGIGVLAGALVICLIWAATHG